MKTITEIYSPRGVSGRRADLSAPAAADSPGEVWWTVLYNKARRGWVWICGVVGKRGCVDVDFVAEVAPYYDIVEFG